MEKICTLVLFILSVKIAFCQIPSGYYTNADNKSGVELQSALHDIIDQHTVISYDGLWNAFYTTDIKSDGKVWDIYSDIPGGTPEYLFSFGSNQCGNYSGEGDCYNREHSFPKSWFNDKSPMISDLFQIFPTDGYVNGKRGNYAYGETSSPSWTSTNGSKLGPCNISGYSGTVFEPIDEYKGDLARTYFYMATRYYGEDSGWAGSDMVDGSQPKAWALAMLLEWNNEDPVSQKEIDRNNAVFAIQKNRNPFIDHPEYADYIWDDSIPNEEAKAPTNHVTDFSAAFITLSWTDATGNNLPQGYLILMSDEGYSSIPVPADGTTPESYTNGKRVNFGTETCTFGNLAHQKTYYFKIYSFSGDGNKTDYKTDGTIPQLQKMTN